MKETKENPRGTNPPRSVQGDLQDGFAGADAVEHVEWIKRKTCDVCDECRGNPEYLPAPAENSGRLFVVLFHLIRIDPGERMEVIEPEIRGRHRLTAAAVLSVWKNKQMDRYIEFMAVMAVLRFRRAAGDGAIFGIKLVYHLIERRAQTNRKRFGEEMQIIGMRPQFERVPGGKDRPWWG